MAFLRTLARLVPLAAALAAISAPASALAEGEACLRDTECAGAELCLSGVCTAASVQSCTTTDDCASNDAECTDGYCKVEGVTCQNPAGACWVVDGGGVCTCGNGDGAGWSDGFNPDDPPEPPTDADLLATCESSLVENCGEDPPALPDSCTGQVLEDCEALIDRENAFFAACGEEVNPIDIARIGRCCDDHDDPMYEAYRECTMDLPSEGCPGNAWSDCEGPNGGTPAGGSGQAEDDTAENGDEVTGRGCTTGRTNDRPGWLAALVLVLLPAGRRRRKR